VLNRLAKDKSLRVILVGFFLFFMVWQPTPAFGAQASAVVTCENSVGDTQSFTIGWNNENNYFLDKGNIPQHYCEGGFAGQFTSFVGVVSLDGGELDPALLYHPSYVAPAPIDSEPDNSVGEENTETVVRTEDVERTEEEATADVARPEEVVVQPEPAPVAPVAPEPLPEPTLEPEPTPEPAPEPKPTPEASKTPVEAPKPSESPSPSPEPSEPSTSLPEPQIPSEPAPETDDSVGVMLAFEAIGKLVDNLRLIGSDMTPEVREQAQQVIVASVIVTQIALAGRKP
jgi:outer membrane biosynthesis protein TonB